MPIIMLIKRIVLYPLKKLGKTIFDLVVLDMAMFIYGYYKDKFRAPEAEDDVVNDYIWPDLGKGKRW